MPTPSSTAPRTTSSRSSLWTPTFTTLAVASFAYFTAAGMLIPALPRFVEGPLGAGNVAVGVVFGIFSVSAVLLRPTAGVLGDRRGRRPLLITGAAIFSASVLAYGLAPNVGVLALLRLAGGAGEALFFVGMVTAFTDLAPEERRGEAMSLASLALYLGIGVGPVIAESVLSRAGFTTTWLATGGVAGLAAVLVVRVPETRPVTIAVGTAQGRLVHPAGLLPGVVLLASIVGMAGFLAFAPLHVLDLGLTAAAPHLLLFAGVVVAIRSAGARLPDLLGPERAIRAALASSVVGLGVVGTWHSVIGLTLGTVVLGVGIALLTPSVFALAASRAPASERGQVMATTSAFIDIAFGIGPVTMGLVAAAVGRPAVFLTGAGVAAAGWVLAAATHLGRQPAVPGPRRRVLVRWATTAHAARSSSVDR